MKVENLKNNWVSVITDVNCSQLSKDEEIEIYSLFAQRKVIIFKNQTLSNFELKQFASIFGNVWDNTTDLFNGLAQTNKWEQEDNFIELVSEEGILKNHKVDWHVDLTHFPSQLIPNRLLYAVALEGSTSATKFIDTVRGLHLIDKDVRKFLQTATAYCKAPYETPWNSYVRRPALGWHPIHNDYGLIADGIFTKSISGLPDDCNYRSWVEENVITPMQSSETIYEHIWELNDIVVYDNWSTIHSRDQFNGTRRLKRITWDQDWNKYKCL